VEGKRTGKVKGAIGLEQEDEEERRGNEAEDEE
jgi:hypothetical protein